MIKKTKSYFSRLINLSQLMLIFNYNSIKIKNLVKMNSSIVLCLISYLLLQCTTSSKKADPEASKPPIPCVTPGKFAPCDVKNNSWSLEQINLSNEISGPFGIAMSKSVIPMIVVTDYGVSSGNYGSGNKIIVKDDYVGPVNSSLIKISDKPEGPFGVTMDGNGTNVLVSLNGQGGVGTEVLHLTVKKAATTTLETVSRIKVGQGAAGIAMSDDGTKALVANNGAYLVDNNTTGNTLTQLTYASNVWTAGDTITVGDGPLAVAMNKDGTRALVTNVGKTTLSKGRTDVPDNTPIWEGNTVTPLSYDSNTKKWTAGSAIAVGKGPVGVAMNNDGTQALVANAWDKDNGVTALSYNSDSNTWSAKGLGSYVVATATGSGNSSITMSGDGKRALVGHANDTIGVYDFDQVNSNWTNTGYLATSCQSKSGIKGIAMNNDGTIAFAVCNVQSDNNVKSVYYKLNR